MLSLVANFHLGMKGSIVEEYFCFNSDEEEDHIPTGEYNFIVSNFKHNHEYSFSL